MAKTVARFNTFLAGVREELKQVTWPDREELLGSALVVFVGVLLMGVFIWICHLVLSRAATFILK